MRDLPECPDVGRVGTGSCAFDLLVRLGLFPGQPNEELAEYDAAVPLGAVVSRGNCYCGRISRHGFIYLVSRYFQDATMAEVSGGGTCIVISTSIGRFKCYEIGDRMFIHFDIGTRSSHVELIDQQKLDDIFLAARGQYLTEEMVNNVPSSKWIRDSAKSLEYHSTATFFGIPNSVIYMTKETLERWTRLRDFAYALIDTVLFLVEELTEPASFVTALSNVSLDAEHLANTANYLTPAEQLAICFAFTRTLSKKKIAFLSFECKSLPYSILNSCINNELTSRPTDIQTYVLTNLGYITTAHQHYRSNKVEISKLYSTSQDRFLLMLRDFQPSSASNAFVHSHPAIRTELKKLLQPNKANNVALVVFQGFLGTFALWNAQRVLMRAREAPEEWIRFLAADEDEIYIG